MTFIANAAVRHVIRLRYLNGIVASNKPPGYESKCVDTHKSCGCGVASVLAKSIIRTPAPSEVRRSGCRQDPPSPCATWRCRRNGTCPGVPSSLSLSSLRYGPRFLYGCRPSLSSSSRCFLSFIGTSHLSYISNITQDDEITGLIGVTLAGAGALMSSLLARSSTASPKPSSSTGW